MLRDVIRHVANALQDANGADPAESALQILESLWVEFKDPTSGVEGGFKQGRT